MVTVALLLGSAMVTGAPLAPPVRSPISRPPASCNSSARVSHELRQPASITTAMLAGYGAVATPCTVSGCATDQPLRSGSSTSARHALCASGALCDGRPHVDP